jgi:excisionase family DNA binding protein
MSNQIEGDIWQNELLTVREVARYLRVSRVTIWRWCQEGIIPASRLGRSWRVHRHDLSDFLEQHGLLPYDSGQDHTWAENDNHHHPSAGGEEAEDLEYGTVVHPAHPT